MIKYLRYLLLIFLLLAQPVFAGKILDVTFNDDTLTDSVGNLTGGAGKRVSDATYHDSSLLKRSFGNRENYTEFSESPNSDGVGVGDQWDGSGVSIAGPPAQSSPLGANTATRVTIEGVQGSLYIQEQLEDNPANDSVMVISAYVNITNSTFTHVWMHGLDEDGTPHGYYYYLSGAGSLGADGSKDGAPINPTITSEGDGWYRISHGFPTSDGGATVNGFIYMSEGDAEDEWNNTAGTHTGGESFDIAGWQIELLPSGNALTEMITAQNNRDFSSETIGNWTAYVDGAGTCTYDGANPSAEKVGKLTSSGDTYLAGQITLGTHTASLSANTYYLASADVYMEAGNTNTTAMITFGSVTGDSPGSITKDIGTGSWETLTFINYFASDVIGTLRVRFDGDPADGDILYFDNVSLQEIPDYAAFYPSTYSGSTNGEAQGHAARLIPAIPRIEDGKLLVEGEGINLLDYSEDFNGNWANTRLSSALNAIGPTGEANTATTLTENGDDNSHRLADQTSYQFVSGTQYTLSAYFKAGERTKALLKFPNSAFPAIGLQVDLTAKTVSPDGSSYDAMGLETIGNGWYRAWCVDTADTTIEGVSLINMLNDALETSYQGNGSTLLVFGANLTETPYPTSYIYADGCPTVRTTEAGSTTNGYTYTMESAFSEALDTADIEGTLITIFTPLYDYGDQDSIDQILAAYDGSYALLRTMSSGKISCIDDGNDEITVDIDFERGNEVVAALTWQGTHGIDKKALDVKYEDSWSYSGLEDLDDNGWRVSGSTLYLNRGRTSPMLINRIVMYDEYMTQAQIEGEPWAEGCLSLGFSLGLCL
ncbi:MAG: hypothetical protein GY820_16980 [Gammaproteobacteria bacterium]|nr:hypothetical protein [Gammaproteobacteria bacterium]